MLFKESNNMISAIYEIEQGMKIPTIESQASNIPMTKGITDVIIHVQNRWLAISLMSLTSTIGGS